MNNFNKHIVLLLCMLFTSVSFSETCIDVLNGALEEEAVAEEVSPRDEVAFNERNLLGFEMTAAMVVWNLIKDNKLELSLTDVTSDQNSIYDSLTSRQKTFINRELQKAFDAIFNGQDNKGQIGYLLWSENDENGFKFATLSELFQKDEDFVIKFIKRNLRAIIYNARRMDWLYSTWVPFNLSHMAARLFNPTRLSQRAKNVWLSIAGGFGLLGLPAPHANLGYAIESCIRGECHEFYYLFDTSARLINDPGAFGLMAQQSLLASAATLTAVGSVFLLARGKNSWRSTRNSPEFNWINYDDEQGAAIRTNFTKEDSDEVDAGSEPTVEFRRIPPAE